MVYLLPFFKPGFMDLHSGEDVRKGALGSVYAVQDFFQINHELVSPLAELDLAALVAQGLVRPGEGGHLAALTGWSAAEAEATLGREALVQLVGRAELRSLTRRAHALGKKVIFDLVLMQSSRDCPLIAEHPEWYLLDENGAPRIHQIAWLVYSDVALFDLVYNRPLQEYLLEIAPYWIEQCQLDGVRIDASQTIDRPFLKKIKNRIQASDPQALVLGETLCPLHEARDLPVDMVYALLVDFHRDVEHAGPLIDFIEETNSAFAPGTMALLKNLQAAVIDCSVGSAAGCNMARGLELGSEWGEETRTDFENENLLDFAQAGRPPHAALVRAYGQLLQLQRVWPEIVDGEVYFHRNHGTGGDPDDRVLVYVRYTTAGALLFLHNFDPVAVRRAHPDLAYLPQPPAHRTKVFDTYAALELKADSATAAGALLPLQTQVWRLY